MLSITTPEMTVTPHIEALHINLGLLLENQASRYADNPFLTLAETGESSSYAEFNRLTNRVAHGLQALGIGQESDATDYMAIMFSNGCEFLATSFALKKIAAIEVAINAGFRGSALASRRNLWFHNGDIARLDAEGYLYWVCRMSERIRVLGEMVSAYEIEEVLMTHPAMADVAVIAVRGFVTLREQASVGGKEIIEYCQSRMSKYMVPREVIILPEMPTTPSGKPARGKLAKWQV